MYSFLPEIITGYQGQENRDGLLISGSRETKGLLNIDGIIISIFICIHKKHLVLIQQTWEKINWLKTQVPEALTKAMMFLTYVTSSRPSHLLIFSRTMCALCYSYCFITDWIQVFLLHKLPLCPDMYHRISHLCNFQMSIQELYFSSS